jgi:cytochrome c-type biogenesis protein CcmH
VAERLAAVRAKLAPLDVAKVPTERGPTADDIAAAASLTPDARAQFIDQMVSGLAARLKTNGSDLAGWQRLIRAYVVLGRSNDAVTALSEARRNFSAEPKSLEQLDALAKTLGLGS